MKDDILETMEESIEDAVTIADLLTEEDERQYDADHVLQIVGMLFSERVDRVQQDYLEERMEENNGGQTSPSLNGGPWQ